jgi:predicted NACHT family NTPase
MARSIRVAPSCISQVKLGLRRHGFPSQKALAEELGIARSTTDKFFTGKPVDFRYFVEISEKLGLDWQAIAYIEPDPAIEIGIEAIAPPTSQQESLEIDTLVQQVRQHCHDKIQTLHGKMQLLDISQPIDLDRLYVDVNILEQITSQRWLEITDLVRGFNPTADNFDRFGLGKVRQERVPGLEAVKRYDRLMVLGKPGAGKTTFLQHVAIECDRGRFQAERVPIFIRLKDFAKSAREQENYRLLDYISREFRCCGITEQQVTEAILTQGRGLILLDGLDEVTDEDENRVVEELQQFSEDYYKNRLIITCRIAASKYRFPGFTDVEVADFNDEQIKSFAEKWFVAVARNNAQEGLCKATQFIQKLHRSENQQIRELAITPILLHLTCLVFQAKTDFPSNRAKLYEQGLNILLKRWDETRGIQRDEVYRSLTVPRKKQLLTQIAAITFERGDYFFGQDEVQQLIADYLRLLPDAKTDPDELQMDSEAVLKAIEAQHGLLVERARGIYSFSHMTFQEYFTAKKFVYKYVDMNKRRYSDPRLLEEVGDLAHPHFMFNYTYLLSCELQALKHLVSYINEKHWREVFLLTAEMLPSADCLLLLMKQEIDKLVANDKKLQQFLMWLREKSLSVNATYKPAAVRAFYFALGHAFDLTLARAIDDTFIPVNFLHPDFIFARGLAFERGLTIDLNCALYLDDTDYDFKLPKSYDVLDFAFIPHNYQILEYVFSPAFDRIIVFELRQVLQQLKEQLPAPDSDREKFKQWWQVNGQDWTEKLRAVMIKHRNIGHDWQLSEQQKKLLSQYYDTNKLLVDCMKSAANLTPAVREEIEETLLLPIAEIEKRASCQDR